MNERERFLAAFSYEPVDHLPDCEFGAWKETFPAWHEQGLPSWVDDNAKFDVYFGLETRRGVPVNIGMIPHFEHEVLSEDEETITYRSGAGVVLREMKHTSSIPQFISYPVETRDDWEAMKERYSSSDPSRHPSDWGSRLSEWRERSYPLGVSCGGYYGWARDLMGVERVSVAFALEGDLIRDMFRFKTEFVIQVVERALADVELDFSSWWEDMCYGHGPLISPAMFKEYMLPEYRKIVDVLESHGVHIHILDCDGKIDELVPWWFEAGINCMFPIESAWTDPVELRKRYGKKLLLMGGVNKRALIAGEDEARRELERLKPLVKDGGFIPHVDHRVPPDVRFEVYLKYLEMKRRLIGVF